LQLAVPAAVAVDLDVPRAAIELGLVEVVAEEVLRRGGGSASIEK